MEGHLWYAFIAVDHDAVTTTTTTRRRRGDSDNKTDQGYETDQGSDKHKDKGWDEQDKDSDQGSNQATSMDQELARCAGRHGVLGDSVSHAAHRLAMLQRQVGPGPANTPSI